MSPAKSSPAKHPRPGPLTKSAKYRSMIQARLDKATYVQPSQPSMPKGEESIIDQFCLHREKHSDSLPGNLLEDHETRKRISYTKEQKLAAVSYITTTWKAEKDGSMKLISKRSAAIYLGITTAMLRDWMKSQATIETMYRGVRKNRTAVSCQEPILEERLVKLFTEARKAGRKITHRWFVRHGQQIYGQLYPGRVVKNTEKKTSYTGFRFSQGWFRGFRQRNQIRVRSPTKISQKVTYLISEILDLININNLIGSKTLLSNYPSMATVQSSQFSASTQPNCIAWWRKILSL